MLPEIRPQTPQEVSADAASRTVFFKEPILIDKKDANLLHWIRANQPGYITYESSHAGGVSIEMLKVEGEILFGRLITGNSELISVFSDHTPEIFRQKVQSVIPEPVRLEFLQKFKAGVLLPPVSLSDEVK